MYSARDRETGETVALKQVRGRLSMLHLTRTHLYSPTTRVRGLCACCVLCAHHVLCGHACLQVKMTDKACAEGFPITALRETNVLLALRHENIVRVQEMVVGSSQDKVRRREG